MAASSARTPKGITEYSHTRTSSIDSSLALSLKYLLPLLFFTTLIIAGVISISYTFYIQEPIPRNAILGLSITFGLLIVITAALMLFLRIRRFYQRRAKSITDEEANLSQEATRRVKNCSKSKDRSLQQENAKNDSSADPDPIFESNHQVSEGEHSNTFQLSDLPFSSSSAPSTGANLQESDVTHLSHPIHETYSPFLNQNPPKNHPLRGSERLTTMKSPRVHSPPPSNDHPAYHLPVPTPPFTRKTNRMEKLAAPDSKGGTSTGNSVNSSVRASPALNFLDIRPN